MHGDHFLPPLFGLMESDPVGRSFGEGTALSWLFWDLLGPLHRGRVGLNCGKRILLLHTEHTKHLLK